jgi:hypothetical protein
VLFWQTTATTPAALRKLAAGASRAECLVREDRRGGLIVCEKGRAPGSVQEMQVTQLFSGGRAGPDAGGWVFFVGLWTPKDWRSEFYAWYKCEHGPILLECPDWEGFQFFEGPTDRGCQFYVLHRLSDRRALDSEWRKLSRSTPWFRRLARNKWFDKPFQRILYRQARPAK